MTNLVNELREYFKENVDHLMEVTREINGWNGTFSDTLEFWENDEEFFNTFFTNPMDAVRASYYGEYNYMDEYVRFNAYGNLESMDEYDVREEHLNMIDDIIEELIEMRHNICVPDEVEEILDRYDEVA